MYCKICGKQILDNQELCDECKAESMIFKTDETVKSKRMEGFPQALIGAISSVIAFYLSLASNTIIAGSKAKQIMHVLGLDMFFLYTDSFTKYSKTVSSVLLVLSFLVCIGAVILGILSVNRFVSLRKEENILKPVATLVLGIFSLFIATVILIINLISFILLIS